MKTEPYVEPKTEEERLLRVARRLLHSFVALPGPTHPQFSKKRRGLNKRARMWLQDYSRSKIP